MRLTLIVVVAVAAALPTTVGAQSTAETRSAAAAPRFLPTLRASVRRSRAEILLLTLRQRRLRLDVTVRNPAAYLRYRYGRVVEVVENRTVNLDRIFLQVVDATSRRVVFSFVAEAPSVNGSMSWTQSWKVDPKLLDCARYLPFGLEIDIERSAPSCPA